MEHEIIEIAVTTTAESKAFRMYSEWELRWEVPHWDGRLQRRRGTHAT